MTELKGKLDKVLLIFCENEILNNRDVPDKATDHLLGSSTAYVLPGLGAACQQPHWEETDFLDRFDKFILARPKNSIPVMKVRNNLSNASNLEQAVADVKLTKNSEAVKLKEAYHRVTEQRIKTYNKFEDVIASENLNTDLLDLKVVCTRTKCLDRLFKETPETLTALKKLKNQIEEELSAAETRIMDLEDAEIAYNTLETNQEYQQLLEKFKKLSMKKRRLELF